MSCKVLISIINYRTPSLTLDCIRSVLDALDGQDGRIVVVDNASGDGSANVIADWIAQQPENTPIHLIRSEKNTGFSGGHNLAINSAKATYYLLLNSDAVLRPGFFHAILDTADATPKAGLIAPQIETDDGDIEVSCF